jgi:hypothetical protein
MVGVRTRFPVQKRCQNIGLARCTRCLMTTKIMRIAPLPGWPCCCSVNRGILTLPVRTLSMDT